MENQRYIIPNLKNACHILSLLSDSPDGMTATEVADSLSLPRTTVLRILTTLTAENFTVNRGKRYSLGYMMINIGSKALNKIDLREIARPALTRLAQETRETAHIAQPADYKSLLVEVVESPEPVSAASRPGSLAEMNCSATGKCFLAWNLKDNIEEYLRYGSPENRTEHSLTELLELRAEMDLIRSKGYAMDNEEYKIGIRCLAAPVRNAGGEVIAAIGITAGAITFTPDMEKEIARKVLSAAASISRMIGG